MKKTLITLMALGGLACGACAAEQYVYNATLMGQEKESAVHGFTLTLTAQTITGATADTPAVSTLSDFVYLDGLTLVERKVNGGTERNVGLLVLDGNNTILGWSNELCATCESSGKTREDNVYTFTNLKLDTDTTYRFVAVSNVNSLTLDYVGCTYGYGEASSYTFDSEAKTVTGGLTRIDATIDVHDGSKTSGDLNFTTKNNFSATTNTWSPVLKDIKVTNIPEPATATLSLLALAGLCARRRRK